MKHFLFLLSALAIFGCQKAPPPDAHIGYIEADWIYISAPEPGRITARPVAEGQSLEPGDVVFTLDDERQKIAISQAETRIQKARAQYENLQTGARPTELKALQAKLDETLVNLKQAKLDYDRISKLVKDGVVPKTQGEIVSTKYAAAKARVKAAREAIRIAKLDGRTALKNAANAEIELAQEAKHLAEENLQRRTVLARTSGRIEDVFRHEGEFVTTGTPILSLLPQDGLKARFYVTQAELANLSIGQKVELKADGRAEPVSAEISYIAKEAEYTPPVIYSVGVRSKLLFLVEANLDANTPLRPGLPVDVTLP